MKLKNGTYMTGLLKKLNEMYRGGKNYLFPSPSLSILSSPAGTL